MKPQLIGVATLAVASVVAVLTLNSVAATGSRTTAQVTTVSMTPSDTARTMRTHVMISPLKTPSNLLPFVRPNIVGEGVFRPAGRTVMGHSAIYTTSIQPADNPTTLAGVAWIDPKLLVARLYSGSLSPGGFFWKLTAPVSTTAAHTLVAAFNGGFLLKDSRGGYLSEGHQIGSLVPGAASLVIFKNGLMTVGEWGRDLRLSPSVSAVRQNLTLIVDHGAPVPGLSTTDTSRWGYSLNRVIDTPRSGLGVTASGALVYVEGEMNEVDLARILVRAGAVRAMVLDMNPLWPVFATYQPSTPTGYATPSNGHDLTATMVQGPGRFFQSSYSRDFVTLSAR